MTEHLMFFEWWWDGGGYAAPPSHHHHGLVTICHSERSEESRNHAYVFFEQQ